MTEEANAFWAEQNTEDWYSKSLNYWRGKEISNDGVLDGFASTSPFDIADSERLLRSIRKPGGTALDCGAGHGRITKSLLIRLFDTVDTVEPSSHYVEATRANVNSEKLRDVHHSSIQDFEIKLNGYDVIWAQWCCLYLTDDDFVSFLKRAAKGIKVGGHIVIKENVCAEADSPFVVDTDDNGLSRSVSHYRHLIWRSGLTIQVCRIQDPWPDHLLSVMIFVLTLTN